MNIQEFIDNLTSDVYSDADALQISSSEAFLVKVCDQLVEAELISNYEVGFFTKQGRNNKTLRMDGYHYEDADGSLCLFIVDDLEDKDSLLNNARIDRLIKMVEEMVYVGIEKKYLLWEKSSSGYEIAEKINTLFKNCSDPENDYDLKKIKVFLLTNKVLSKLFKNEKRDEIHDIPVEYSIFDATRLFDMAKSGFSKEIVNINFSDYGVNGLYGMKSVEKSGEFISYLVTMPGKVLASIYLDKGTQILEGNVRSFLSVRGKVNKSIRKTILEEPEKFFVLNNGITVTGDSIKYTEDNHSILITEIENMQIVNGGQTTASLANTILKDKADLSKVKVMMKLSVLDNHDLAEKLVPEISRASNSQNKVDEADFFSNHPFHIKLQELSERNLAPPVDGNQYQTSWFYERARGQYTVQEMRKTPSEIKAWRLKNPKNQILRKTDVAKYYMTYDCKPHEVSKGAQSVMKKFAEFIQGTNGDNGFWANDSSEVNREFFRDLVAKAIIFKESEKIISNLSWYKEVKAYRANIVTYSIAIIVNEAMKKKMSIDLKAIWNSQHLYSELTDQIIITSKEVYDFLTREDRTTQNVTEWAKKPEAWKRAQNERWKFNESFYDTLVGKDKPKKNDVTESVVDSMNFVNNINAETWIKLKEWGKQFLYLSPKDEAFINLAIDYHTKFKIPSDKQFKAIVSVYNMLIKEGYNDKS